MEFAFYLFISARGQRSDKYSEDSSEGGRPRERLQITKKDVGAKCLGQNNCIKTKESKMCFKCIRLV